MCMAIQKSQTRFALHEDQTNSPNLLRDLKLPFRILKFVGLFPMFTQIKDNDIEGPSYQANLYSVVVRTMLLFLTVFNLYSMFHQNTVQDFATERETDNINQYIEIVINITTYAGTTILCSKHSFNFLTILKDILKVDANIQYKYQAKIKNQCKFATSAIFGIIFVQLFLIGIKFMAGSVSTHMQFLIVVVYALQNCISSMFMILLAALLRLVSVRFEFVNMILERYGYNVFGIKGRRSFEEDVAFAFRLHNKLLRIYKLLNESFSLMVAFFMGYAFYSITTNTYNIFVEFTTYAEVSWSFLLDCFVWLGYNSVLLVILASNCGQATEKANTLSQIVARIYGKNKDYQTITDKFLTKSIRQEVEFTAYGFFVVDSSTLFKIFTAVTTYLVILIQFKQLEETKFDDSR